MDITAKGTLLAVCNWIVAVMGIAISVYVCGLVFWVPPDSQPKLVMVPAASEAQPVSATASQAPKITVNPAQAKPSDKPSDVRPLARIAAQGAAKSEPEPAEPSGAPRVKHPGTPQPALNPATIPPGLGKDF